ncbi:MAG: hypothetical protein K2X72_31570 [Reyranella sp.]|nr:hypothetical protein [Reyranella sp.]
MIENYTHKYLHRGKHVFVPTERCVRKGRRIIAHFRGIPFPQHFYHYQSGGHIAALHAHLANSFFFKIDIQSFYYAIARQRVTRVLMRYRMQGALTHAMWSSVATPYRGRLPRYVLPIGFVQSPLLASLVLLHSPVNDAIVRAQERGVTMSVYLDDIVGSHNDQALLQEVYDDIRQACVEGEFIPNPSKLTPPSSAIVAFNCDLVQGSANVTPERVAEFYADADRSALSMQSFEEYRERVAAANV